MPSRLVSSSPVDARVQAPKKHRGSRIGFQLPSRRVNDNERYAWAISYRKRADFGWRFITIPISHFTLLVKFDHPVKLAHTYLAEHTVLEVASGQRRS